MKTFYTFLFLFSSSVFAWGPRGQEITVAIAEKYLSKKASAEILKLTKNQKLSSFATWADQARNAQEWKETGSWHYINVSDSGEYQHTASSNPLDVQDAIDFSIERLKSNIPSDQKLTWLKFLVHFVGDIHQPMHIGREADRGGNSTMVSFGGKKVNLHFLWDTAILESRGLSANDYVQALVSQNRSTKPMQDKFDSNQVIKENFALRTFMYGFKNNTIDGQYQKQALDIVDDRLWVGGMRLANVLNGLYL